MRILAFPQEPVLAETRTLQLGSLPGTELEVRARLKARTETGLALQDWEPINPLEPLVFAATPAGTATPSTAWS